MNVGNLASKAVKPIQAAPVELPSETINRSVVEFPEPLQSAAGSSVITFRIAAIADSIIPWGQNVYLRDRDLRNFWPTEPVLAGAIFGVAASHAAFSWKLVGPKATTHAVQTMLHSANYGKGWMNFVTKLTIDLLTQDNGAFVELIRTADSPSAPVLGIATLDSAQCIRTGSPDYPVIYRDTLTGQMHKMAWYQIIPFEELPSPIERMYDVQYSAVTRILRAAQILRDIAIFKGEKVGGRFQRSIHIVGGPAKQEIKDALSAGEAEADNQGLIRFMMPTILASLDPTKPVSHVEIPLASLPDNFDMDKEMKWYIAQVALGLGLDYQDLAPLPSGGLGSSNQSEMLHLKSRGKGPAFFMKLLEHKFNFHGVLPKNVKMEYAQSDLKSLMDEADLGIKRANRRARMIQSGEITTEVARQIAVEEGDLDEQYLQMMAESDASPEDHQIDDLTNQDLDDLEVEPLKPSTPPGAIPPNTPAAQFGSPRSQWTGNAQRTQGPTPRPSSGTQRPNQTSGGS
ncbi:MAG: hypothetical protein QUS07_07425 [Methanothrix sp.]|nr:hypothetical protein [Methanothrix sp.]